METVITDVLLVKQLPKLAKNVLMEEAPQKLVTVMQEQLINTGIMKNVKIVTINV